MYILTLLNTRIICHLVNGTDRLINAVIYTMLGEAVNTPVTSDGAQTLTLSVNGLATGSTFYR
jgi:hypothetical protein